MDNNIFIWEQPPNSTHHGICIDTHSELEFA